MATPTSQDDDFEWLVGQSLTPNRYSRLGKIWEVGKVWLSNKILDIPTSNLEAAQIQSALPEEIKTPGGVHREGLASEEDLLGLHNNRPVKAGLFGSPVIKKETDKKKTDQS